MEDDAARRILQRILGPAVDQRPANAREPLVSRWKSVPENEPISRSRWFAVLLVIVDLSVISLFCLRLAVVPIVASLMILLRPNERWPIIHVHPPDPIDRPQKLVRVVYDADYLDVIGADIGYLTECAGWLTFEGEHTRFSLRRADVTNINTSPNAGLRPNVAGPTGRVGATCTALNSQDSNRFRPIRRIYEAWKDQEADPEAIAVFPVIEPAPSELSRVRRLIYGNLAAQQACMVLVVALVTCTVAGASNPIVLEISILGLLLGLIHHVAVRRYAANFAKLNGIQARADSYFASIEQSGDTTPNP